MAEQPGTEAATFWLFPAILIDNIAGFLGLQAKLDHALVALLEEQPAEVV